MNKREKRTKLDEALQYASFVAGALSSMEEKELLRWVQRVIANINSVLASD